MENKFCNALQNLSLEEIKEVPKSDIHNHASRGGNIKYISKCSRAILTPPVKPFHDAADMQAWFTTNIKGNCRGLQGYLKCIEAAFVQAREDNIHILAMSFGIYGIDSLGNIKIFADTINMLHKIHAPEIHFYPELTLRRENNTDYVFNRLDELLSINWFRSIDICGYEQARPIKCFKPIYRKAKQHGLKLKAHVGEFGSAEDVMEAVEELELCEVHHGIAVVQSKDIMRRLSDSGIQFNICPTSNIMMGLVDSYAEHPIKNIVSSGIPVTINTDDMLIFNQSVSEEFLNLYKNGVMSITELEIARQNGLSAYL